MNRRHILTFGLAAGGVLAGAGLLPAPLGLRGSAWADSDLAPPQGLYEDEHILGDKAAPITIIEYSSLTCPHCASFHDRTLPELEEKWITPGKVNLAYRHFPLDRVALAAALISDCLPEGRFFKFVELLFAKQSSWARSQDVLGELRKFAKFAGMSDEAFDACLRDQEALNRIQERQVAGRDAFEISATPTFMVGEQKIQGAQPIEVFEDVLKGV